MKHCHNRVGYGVAVVLLALTLAPNPVWAQHDTTPIANAENGRKAFIAHGCYTCHGYEAEGGVGFRLVAYAGTLDSLVAYVRQPKGIMPPSGANIKAQELLDILSWIRSIPPSPDAKTIGLLRPDFK